MRYLTPEEISEILKVPVQNIIKWVESGILQSIKIDGVYRIVEEDFKDFINSFNRNQRSSEEILLLRQKTNAYFMLVEWLELEIQILSEIYRDLEHVLEHMVDYLRGNLENHRKSGDHHNERYVGDYLLQFFDHWEKPRKNYQDWLNKYEQRWHQFQNNSMLHINNNENLDLYFHHTEWPQFYKYNKPIGIFPSRAHHEVRTKNEYYHKKYIWLKKELDDLCRHYHKFNRTIKKILRKLSDARKRCSKEMDFKKGYMIHEMITMLYMNLEKPRKKYNYWLMGKEERWQEFKTRNISRLREIGEITEIETIDTFNSLTDDYIAKKVNAEGNFSKGDYNKDLIRDSSKDTYNEVDEGDYEDEFDDI